MEPLKPTTKRAIQQASPTASEDEIREYQRLLGERFMVDPDLPRDAASESLREQKSVRLKELQEKLFPNKAEADTEP